MIEFSFSVIKHQSESLAYMCMMHSATFRPPDGIVNSMNALFIWIWTLSLVMMALQYQSHPQLSDIFFYIVNYSRLQSGRT